MTSWHYKASPHGGYPKERSAAVILPLSPRQPLLSEREKVSSTTAVESEGTHPSNAVRVPRKSRSAIHLARVPKGETDSRSESSVAHYLAFRLIDGCRRWRVTL